MVLTENSEKDSVRQADMRLRTMQPPVYEKQPNYMKEWREKHPNYKKDYMKEWNKGHPNYLKEWREKHPNYKKDYMKEWNEKHPNHMKEWNRKHPNYMKEWSGKHPNYKKEWREKHPNRMKEWTSSIKRINAGSTLEIEGVDFAVLSESDKSIFREIDEAIRKESASKHDEW